MSGLFRPWTCRNGDGPLGCPLQVGILGVLVSLVVVLLVRWLR